MCKAFHKTTTGAMNNADVLNFYIYLPRISIKTNALMSIKTPTMNSMINKTSVSVFNTL